MICLERDFENRASFVLDEFCCSFHVRFLACFKECVNELRKPLRNDGCVLPPLGHFDSGAVPGKKKIVLPGADLYRNVWFPVGYHPWWSRIMKRAIKGLNNDSTLQDLVRYAVPAGNVQIRIAWRNMLPCNQKLLKR